MDIKNLSPNEQNQKREAEWIELLKEMDDDMLIAVYCTLSHWKWHNALGDLPKGWDDAPNWDTKSGKRTKYQIITPLMEYIQSRMPHKEILEKIKKAGGLF